MAEQKVNKTENNSEIKTKRYSKLGETWKILRRNKSAMLGLAIISVIVFCALFADIIAPFPYDEINLDNEFARPSLQNLFGTDNFGRDIFSRIVYGARISLQVGFVAVGIAAIIGVFLGSLAGYYGKNVDSIIMRIMDVLLAIPSILLAIAITAAFGGGLTNVMIAVGISSVPSYVRIVRATILSVKEQEFIEAARATGASDFRIIFTHILPNSLSPLIVQATLGVAGAILSAAGLSFIGLGLQPPAPEWGAMLSEARSYFTQHPHMVMFPGLSIMLTIFALNLFGDGLRDALDPKLKR